MNHEGFESINSPEGVLEHNKSVLVKELDTFLSNESMGGNAGTVTLDGKVYSCAVANTYVDKETGKILGFSNYPEDLYKSYPDSYRQNIVHIYLRAPFDIRKGGFFKILDADYRKEVSAEAQQNISAAIEHSNTIRESYKVEGL